MLRKSSVNQIQVCVRLGTMMGVQKRTGLVIQYQRFP